MDKEKPRKPIVGYATGVFDLFHQGHLDLLRNAKALCDKLIVGVSTDELCYSYKKKYPVMSFRERVNIMKAIKYVDAVVPQEDMDKYKAWETYQFDVVFHGQQQKSLSNWKGSSKLKKKGVKIVLLPILDGVSATVRRKQHGFK